jgi:hypothetical protein
MLSAHRSSLITSFPICISFTSSYCFIALARNSKSMLNHSGESGYHCLFPNYRGNVFSFFLFSMMLAVCLSYTVFIMLSFIPSFIRAYIVKICWILLKAFSVGVKMIKWFLSLLLLICCIIFNDSCVLNHPCNSGMKVTLSWCMIFLICFWIQFANILLNIFPFILVKDIGL